MNSQSNIGGGTDTSGDNERLNVISAPSAVPAGTVELDDGGNSAIMAIRGAVTIEPSFTVLVDVTNSGAIPAERLTFPTGRVALAGILGVNVTSLPPPGAQYRVVSTVDGTGKFDSILNAEVFVTIQEDAPGVLLIR